MKHPTPRGRFITFEGIEGSGKSMQLTMLAEHLQRHGLPYTVTREPGGTKFGGRLREILLETGGPPRIAVAEFLLYLADRCQDLAEVVEPALRTGQYVLCDRYHDATRAYQGCARGLGLPWVDAVARCLKIRIPDRTLILDLPVTEGLRRARSRNLQEFSRLGRFEAESLRFHRQVRKAYLAFARAEPKRICVIRASGTPDQVFARVLRAVEPLLPDPRP